MPDRSVTYTFKGAFGNLTAGLATAGKNVSEFGTKLNALDASGQKMRAGLTDIADTAGRASLVLGGAFAATVIKAANFEQAMSYVQAATHESAAAMEELRQAALDAGADTAFSATESAAAIEELAKAGVATEQILGGGLQGALDLAAAGGLDVASAAEAAASAMTQFKLSGEDVPHIADLLAAGAGKAQGEVSDMAAALNQSGLVAAQTGLTIEETTGALSAFASAGLLGSDAGTSFKTMLQSLTPSSKQARDLMAELGISAYDAQGNFVGLTEFAGSLRAGLENLSVEQQNAALKTIFGSDAVRAAAVIYEQGADGIQSWIDKTNDAGYASETAAIRMDNLKGDLEQLGGALETLLIGSGEGQTGFLRGVTQGATDLVNVLNDLPGPIKSISGGLLGLTALGAGGFWFTSKAITTIAETKAALTALGVSSDTVRQKLTLLNAVKFTGLTAAAALAIPLLSNDLDTLSRSMSNAKASTEGLDGILEALNKTNVGKYADDLGIDMQKLAEDLYTNGESGQYVAETYDLLNGKLDSFGDNAKEAITYWLPGITSGQNKAAEVNNGLNKVIAENGDLLGKSAEHARAAAIEEARLAGVTLDLADASNMSAEEIRLTTEQLKTITDNANDAAGSFVNLTAGITDGKFSFEDWVSSLEDAGQAIKDLRVNSREALENGVDEGVVQELKNMGTEGALQLKYLATASESEVERTNKALRKIANQTAKSVEQDVANAQAGLGDVGASVDALDGAKAEPHIGASTAAFEGGKKKVDRALAALNKDKAEPSIDLNDGAFQSAREAASRQLTDLTKPRTVPITASVDLSGAWARLNSFFGAASRGPSVSSANAAEKKRAFGGLVTGPGGPTDDLIPTWLSNREYVIRASAVEKYGVGFFDAVNAERLATGGQPGKTGKPRKNESYLGFFPEVGLGLNAFIKSLEASKDALDDELSARKSVAEALASSVTGKFTSDLFGNTNIWSAGGSLADAIATLQGDIAGSQAFQSDVASLRALGLSGAALDSLLTQADPETVANIAATASAESVAEFQRLFQQRIEVNAATVTAAQMATGVAQEIATLGAKVDQTNAHLATLTGIQSDIQKTGPTKTGNAVGKTNNKGASKAQLNRLRG